MNGSDALAKLQAFLEEAGFNKTAREFTQKLGESMAKELSTRIVSKQRKWQRKGGATSSVEDLNDELETTSSYDGDSGGGKTGSYHTGGLRRRNPLGGFARGTKRRRGDTAQLGNDDVEEFLAFALDRYRRQRGFNVGAGRLPQTSSIELKLPDYTDLKKEIIKQAVHMQSSGLVLHTSGNLSIRVPQRDLMLVTPTGMDYKALTPADIVIMDFKGNALPNQRAPSSEWRFHGDIYSVRPDAKAIVHTHSTYCTTLACLRRDVPAFHYMIGAAGGSNIRCAKYGTYGTQELSDAAVEALEGRQACLLANHGMISLGKDLKSAMKLAEIVENMCEIYWKTLAVSGPVVLDDQEMEVILRKFKTYGKQPKKTCC